MKTQKIGSFGETAAAEYLENKGYEIIQRNFRLKCGEIDIIAQDDDTTVFVEVKTRKNDHYGSAAEFVDSRKQLKIKKTAAAYTDVINGDVRFDVIEVYYHVENGTCVTTGINHIRNAF